MVAACGWHRDAVRDAAPPTAVADGKVLLGGGAGIALNGNTLCTLTTIGHDNTGDLLGLTSAHCGGPGSSVAAETTHDTVGNVVAADDGLDYAVIKFDPAKVTPIPNFDGFPINGIGPKPDVWQRACKCHNPLMPATHAERLGSLLPNAQLRCVDEAYVLIMLDQPERVAAEIKAFLTR